MRCQAEDVVVRNYMCSVPHPGMSVMSICEALRRHHSRVGVFLDACRGQLNACRGHLNACRALMVSDTSKNLRTDTAPT